MTTTKEATKIYKQQKDYTYCASPVFRGFRDVMWCPTANEPAWLEWDGDQIKCPWCKSYEAETHIFVCHINKPRSGPIRIDK